MTESEKRLHVPDLSGFVPAVQVTRGGRVESFHLAAVVAADPGGRMLFALGDGERPIYCRSTAKPFQAAPLVSSGAAEHFRLTDRELAVACASHSAEPFHLEVVRGMLAKGDLTEADLQCGPHPPMHAVSAETLIRKGVEPMALHNNCSGKHAGMLLLARHLKADLASYLEPGNPVQRRILEMVAECTGVPAGRIPVALDGCSAPTFAVPMVALARAYARLAAALQEPAAASALGTVAAAMVGRPEMVAGSGRLDTLLMASQPGKVIGKLGAEGMYAVAACGAGGQPFGMVVKIADGDADRARSALVLDLLAALGVLGNGAGTALRQAFPSAVHNRRGTEVGEIRVCRPPLPDEEKR